ncbi:hypothetical protein KW792_01300 [Candidatus Saccharibacteria bacterium]|nr:hypothetical protein [Candidatus Saccharibacteria bacterium]
MEAQPPTLMQTTRERLILLRLATLEFAGITVTEIPEDSTDYFSSAPGLIPLSVTSDNPETQAAFWARMAEVDRQALNVQSAPTD